MQKNEAIQNYKIKPEEEGSYHVCFTRIIKEGKRTKDVHTFQTFSKREFEGKTGFLSTVQKLGLAGITQQDEMEIAHDPNNIKQASPEIEAPKQAPKPKGRPPIKKVKK